MSAPPILTHDPSAARASIAGPADSIPAPFPIYLQGWVEAGFGRGSSEIGCPTGTFSSRPVQKSRSKLQKLNKKLIESFQPTYQKQRLNDMVRS